MNPIALLTRPLAAVLVGASLATATAVRADELERICEFLEANVINRTILMETEGTHPGGAVGYVFRRELTLCNLVRVPAGLRYDAIYRITQENWDIENGQKKGESRAEDRMFVVRYEYGVRRSTGEVAGCSQTLTATTRQWGGMTRIVRISLEDDRLRILSEPGFYDDHFGPENTFYAGASVDNHLWFVEDGKLVCETRTTVYRVDPKTLRRELLEDQEPVVEREIARLPLE